MTAAKKITNRIAVIVLPIVVLLLSGACSIRYFVPEEGTLTEDRYAVVRSDSLQFALRPQSYLGNYQDVNNRFFPVFIRVKNSSTRRIKVPEGSFGILANDRQFDPVPLQYILANLRQSIWLKSYDNLFQPEDPSQSVLDKTREQDMYYELLSSAFSYGDILPGGSKEGYLFYDRAIDAAEGFTFDALGYGVRFRRK